MAASIPIASAYAQQASTPKRLGVMLLGFMQASEEVHAFRQGLWDANYVEGRNITIEWRAADGNQERVGDLVAADSSG